MNRLCWRLSVVWSVVCLLVLPIAAAAQNWQLAQSDDGSFFTAYISGGDGFALACGERSSGGLTALQTGNTEPEITQPGVLRMYLDPGQIGPVEDWSIRRTDVMIVVGTTGFTLPGVIWDELNGTWFVDLAVTDPVFAAVAASRAFEIRSTSGVVSVDASDFAGGINALAAYCQTKFAAIGLVWQPGAASAGPPPPKPAASGQAPSAAVARLAAEAGIVEGCEGPATRNAGYLLVGDIDGDGAEDAVLDWGKIACAGQYPRPFCGAAMCSADVYLSRLGGAKVDLLALGVSLVQLSNGNLGVSTGGTLTMCQNTGQSACQFVWYWNGSDLVKLN